MERRWDRQGLIWAGGTAGVFGLALAGELDGTLLHTLGCGLLCALMGLALRLTAGRGGWEAALSRWEWLVLCLPALGLGAAVLVMPLTGLAVSLFLLSNLLLGLFLHWQHRRLTGTVLAMALLLCWFGCYCALSNLCISPDSYSYYEMAQTLFTDFGRVSTIRQYVVLTDYGISFPYFYPLLLAVVDGLSGLGMYSGVLLNVFLSMAAALLFVPLSRRLCSHSWPGVMAAIALLTNRKYLSEVLSGRAIPAAVLCVIIILLLLSGPDRWGRRNLALVGVMAGISMVTRFDNLTVVGFVGLCVLLLSGKGRWSCAVCYGLGALAPLLPWCVYSMARFGVPWISDNGGTLTLVEVTIPQRFFLPGEEAATLFTDPGAWLQALGGRFHVVLLLLALTFVSTQVLLPGAMLAVVAARGRLAGRRTGAARPSGRLCLPVLIVVFYGLKTLAYCLVGYATARYHAETVVLVIFAVCCLLAPYVSWRTARAGTALYLVLALWAGLVYSTPLSQTIPSLCRHSSYASCLNFGYQEQDESWRALWDRVSGQPLVTEQVAHMPDWVAELEKLVDDEDARLFFLSGNGDPYAYGAYAGQKTFAAVVNLNEERCFYLMDRYICPTHIVISSENDRPWVDTLDRAYGLTLLGEVEGNLVYRVGDRETGERSDGTMG